MLEYLSYGQHMTIPNPNIINCINCEYFYPLTFRVILPQQPRAVWVPLEDFGYDIYHRSHRIFDAADARKFYLFRAIGDDTDYAG
jgi:hypothetical protein